MDSKELEKNLTEIEERLDRVRALYEQYFCGIEKVEPQVPRKDLERRIFVLRKEQIRNTAMRFKFQTLTQRYNTLSQHWGRILRDIENGTYKRDLARAAARFGVDDALTAVGRKRAERLAKGLEAQVARDEARKQRMRELTEDYEEVADDDIQEADDFDDEAPTPPPLAGAGQAPSPMQAEETAAGDARPVLRGGVGFFQNLRAGQPKTNPDIAPVPLQRPGELGQSSPLVVQPLVTPMAPPVAPIPAAPVPEIVQTKAKTAGGLRLGGGPSRKVNTDALSRIANSLAPPGDASPAPAEATQPGPRKPLLSSPLGLDIPDSSPPRADAPAPSPPPPAPATEARAEPPSSRAASGLKPPAARPASPLREPIAREAPAREAVAREPVQQRPAARAKDDNISNDRLREIYSQYVQSRRDRNESTTGITFDKLADSLRTQADKLKEKHSAKKVDYEVVVKDGKTLIKPIVR